MSLKSSSFRMLINDKWLVESVKEVTKILRPSSAQRQASICSRLFVDYIAANTETVPQTKDIMNKLSEKLPVPTYFFVF